VLGPLGHDQAIGRAADFDRCHLPTELPIYIDIAIR